MRYQPESKQLAFNTIALVDLHFIFRLGIHLIFLFVLKSSGAQRNSDFFLPGIKLFLVLKLAITSYRAKSLNSYS